MPKTSSVHHCQLRMASNVMDDFSFPYIYSWADVERSSTGAHLRTYPCTTHVRVTVRSKLNHRVRVCVRARVWGHAAPDTLASAIPWIISGANELFGSSLLSPRLHCPEISMRFSLPALIIPRSVRRVTSLYRVPCGKKEIRTFLKTQDLVLQNLIIVDIPWECPNLFFNYDARKFFQLSQWSV